jgi:aromatic-amino-acid transaminase
MFQHLEPYAGDPILSLNEAFQADPRPGKINLSIGIYFDDAGRIPVLDCVRQAEAQMLADSAPKSYLPIEGAAAARSAVQKLLFGADHEAVTSGRVATLQTVGSSGGLKVGADFLKRWFPGSALWVSDPTWDNHRAMFEGAGVTVHTYPYYDAATGGLKFDAMLQTLRGLPARSVVLLHACCHNPTGVDLTQAQWEALIPVLRERELLPYLDLAYQGYGDGIQEDAFAVRALASAGLSFFVANSFSKSMSVYGERAGALSVVCADAGQAERVLGQMKATVRRNYSSPAIHAAGIISRVPADIVGVGRGRHARAHPGDAQVPAWGAQCAPARTRLRLLPDAAGHVQLYRLERGAGGPPARGVRRVPGALRPHVRGRAEHRQCGAHGAGHGGGAELKARQPRRCVAKASAGNGRPNRKP